MSLLEVRGLSIELPGGVAGGRPARAVEGLDLDLEAGQTLALVGESGSGKTLTALALLDVLPTGMKVRGTVRLGGRDLGALDAAARRACNGRDLGLVFQEPGSAFDPVFPIGAQIAAVVRRKPGTTRAAAAQRVLELLAEVGLSGAHAVRHPHELSGGQRQRAMLALALAGDPTLLVADEPTSALDTVLEAEILALLGRLQRARGMGLLLITHDLSVVAALADRLAVLYAGRVVEEGPVAALFERPRHPYTAALLDAARLRAEGVRAVPLEGSVPAPGEWPGGCSFHPRCPFAEGRCERERPLLESGGGAGRRAACFFPEKAGPASRSTGAGR